MKELVKEVEDERRRAQQVMCMFHVHNYICIYVRMYVRTYVCMYVGTYVCVYVRTYASVYAKCSRLYFYVHMYTYFPASLSICSFSTLCTVLLHTYVCVFQLKKDLDVSRVKARAEKEKAESVVGDSH